MVRFYLAIVKDVLLFVTKTRLVTPHIRILLGGFHHSVVRQIVGKNISNGLTGAENTPLRMRLYKKCA